MPTQTNSPDQRWEVALDVQEVHNLLCACDAYFATTAVPAPTRNLDTTARRVTGGSVHLLRQNGCAVAMFTLTSEPPFDESKIRWPKARNPVYVSRLAIEPKQLAEGTILGLRCYRRVFELALREGADVVRLEANPDLTRVKELLDILGFVRCTSVSESEGLKRIYLQKPIG